MERPDFFTLRNGEKVKLPFSPKEYQDRVYKLRKIMSDNYEKKKLYKQKQKIQLYGTSIQQLVKKSKQ